MSACINGDERLASEYAHRLGFHANDELGADGFAEMAHLGRRFETVYMLDPYRLTPAMLICLSEVDQPSLIRALAGSGAALPADSFGQARLLKAAAERGHSGVVRALFYAGCDPNSTFEPWGCPVGEADAPVIFSAVWNIEVFNAFLSAGCKIDVRDAQGQSLADRIARVGSPEVQRAFAAQR